MPKAVWKGAIAFGLVHVPVSMYPASQDNEIDFDWLDRRSMDPVGYKRVNKRTGKEIGKEDIVKGVKVSDGTYVVLSEDEVRAAYPRTTQTIDIEHFVPAADVSFVYIERPYYLEPSQRAEKPYALLREAMEGAALIGIARLVMHNKEHLAALLPAGPALMLGTLRWANEIRPAEELKLPEAGKGEHNTTELDMARRLIDQMKAPWRADAYRDRFTESIQKLVDVKHKAGDAKSIEPLETAPSFGEANVVDLTELLKNSLHGRRTPVKSSPKRAAKGA